MAVTRRALLKASIAAGVGAFTGVGAYGYSVRPACARGHARVDRRRGLPPALAGLRIGLLTDVHRSRLGVGRRCGPRRLAADGGTAGPDRPRRRLRHVGRSPVRRSRRRRPRSRSPRRTASSASSATTTTITTCRRRSHETACRCSRMRARGSSLSDEPIDLVGIRFWTRRASDIAALLHRRARHYDPAGARSAAS